MVEMSQIYEICIGKEPKKNRFKMERADIDMYPCIEML